MNENENTVAQEQAAAESTETQATQTETAAQPAPEKPQAPVATAQADAAKATDAAKDTPDELTQTRGQLTKALELALNAEARAAAAGLGVKADRIQYAVRLADLSGIDLTQADAAQKVSAAIGKVLEALPELRGGAGTGSLGGHARQQQMNEQDKAQAEFDRGLGL